VKVLRKASFLLLAAGLLCPPLGAETATVAPASTPKPAPAAAPPVETSPGLEQSGFSFLDFLELFELPENWSGEFSLGFSRQQGQVNRIEQRFEVNLRVQQERNDLRYRLFYIYGKQDGRPSNDRLQGSFRFRRNLSGPSFVQAISNYEKDRVRRINHEIRQSLGYGMAVIQRPRMKFDIVPGLAATYLERSAGDFDPWKLLLNLDQNFNWQIAENLSFIQNTDFLYEPTDDHNYRINFQSRVESRILGKLSLALRYQRDYTTFVNPGVVRLTERFFTTVGYKF
jgi:putative salt-induced outer membrane protein YdiY